MGDGIHLRAVGVRTSIGHGQHPRTGVSELKVLIIELVSIDTLSSGAVEASEVTPLAPTEQVNHIHRCWMGIVHEVRDDAMELAAPIGECLAASPHPLLSRAECSKILSSARYLWHMSRGDGRPPVRCSRRGSSRCGPPAGRRWRRRSRPPDSSRPVGSPRTEFARSPARGEEAPSSPRHPSNKRSDQIYLLNM